MVGEMCVLGTLMSADNIATRCAALGTSESGSQKSSDDEGLGEGTHISHSEALDINTTNYEVEINTSFLLPANLSSRIRMASSAGTPLAVTIPTPGNGIMSRENVSLKPDTGR